MRSLLREVAHGHRAMGFFDFLLIEEFAAAKHMELASYLGERARHSLSTVRALTAAERVECEALFHEADENHDDRVDGPDMLRGLQLVRPPAPGAPDAGRRRTRATTCSSC